MTPRIGALAALIAAAALPASAHHSYAMFDRGKTVVLVGEVQAFDMIAPHGWLKLLALQGQDPPRAFALEMGPPGVLMRQGWTARSVAPGDKLTARIHPMRDGSSGGQLISVKLADGKTLIGGPESGSGHGGRGFDPDER